MSRDRLTEIVLFRVTAAEKRELERRAKAKGWTLSDVVREALFVREDHNQEVPR